LQDLTSLAVLDLKLTIIHWGRCPSSGSIFIQPLRTPPAQLIHLGQLVFQFVSFYELDDGAICIDDQVV
jgi:hypothetical protein